MEAVPLIAFFREGFAALEVEFSAGEDGDFVHLLDAFWNSEIRKSCGGES
jgi:hypothetical protein